MSKPIISVITPTYNCAKFISRSYFCLLSQTFSDWEWVVVDDGSTDDSAIILADLRASDPRVRVFNLEFNRGRGYARNIALDNALSDCIVIWDIDDLYLFNRLELIQSAFKNGYDFFASYALVVDTGLGLKGARHFKNKTTPFSASFVHPTLAFKKSALGRGYNERMSAGEDLELMIILQSENKGFYCREYLMLYVEDREINLNKTICMHSSHLHTSFRLLQSGLFKLSFSSRVRILGKLYLKTLILFLLRPFPRIYLISVRFRQKDPIISSLLTSNHLLLFKRFKND
jgi:glycosyltransferase involved in cell wall biosynthesis